MIHFKSAISAMSVFFLLTAPASAQTEVRVDAPPGNRLSWLTRPYQTRSVPPAVLANTARLESLIRSGILYLTAEDVVALAIENNIDVEVQRYAPLLAQEVLRRAQSGVSLSSVGAGIAAGNGVSSGGGIVTQLGPAIQSFDPSLLLFTNFQHSTIPQSNTFLTGTTALIQNSRTYQAQYSQNWDFGFTAQATYTSQYTKVNSQLFSLNPYTFGSMDLQLTQNLLQGFGRAVNGRNIRVQRNNVKISNLQFKQQVIATVAAALNLYWDLVSFDEDVLSRKHELETAQLLLEDNKKQVNIGALAPIEVTRAEAQLYTGQQDLVIAQTNLLQQETVLKNALRRNGIASANLNDVHIVPLDRIRVPDQDEIRPMEQLVEAAISNRVEIDQARINLESNQMNLVGIKNSLKPTLQAFAELTNNGLTGDLTAVGAMLGAQYLAGGYGNLLGQIARRNYPNYS